MPIRLFLYLFVRNRESALSPSRAWPVFLSRFLSRYAPCITNKKKRGVSNRVRLSFFFNESEVGLPKNWTSEKIPQRAR